jgi:hypothetical protein
LWEVERYWKLSGAGAHATFFAGTPCRPMIMRLVGAKVGRCVYDDGFNMSERSLVEIGDGAVLNQGVMLQSHSLEEGAYRWLDAAPAEQRGSRRGRRLGATTRRPCRALAPRGASAAVTSAWTPTLHLPHYPPAMRAAKSCACRFSAG